MRHAIGISILLIAAVYIAFELYRTQHPGLPWVKRRRARRIRWQWARRQPGAVEPEAGAPPAPQP
jgi:hypothetical protein